MTSSGPLHKLCHLDGTPHDYGNHFEVEHTTGPRRLVIGPTGRQIELITRLMQEMEEPFHILYVLLVGITHEPGRYQLERELSRDEAELLLWDFQTFFESDGRHHLWIHSVPSDELLVYDQHNVIYAYGRLSHFAGILRERGYHNGKITFPKPHHHHFHPENHQEEDRLLSDHAWHHSSLEPEDEY